MDAVLLLLTFQTVVLFQKFEIQKVYECPQPVNPEDEGPESRREGFGRPTGNRRDVREIR